MATNDENSKSESIEEKRIRIWKERLRTAYKRNQMTRPLYRGKKKHYALCNLDERQRRGQYKDLESYINDIALEYMKEFRETLALVYERYFELLPESVSLTDDEETAIRTEMAQVFNRLGKVYPSQFLRDLEKRGVDVTETCYGTIILPDKTKQRFRGISMMLGMKISEIYVEEQGAFLDKCGLRKAKEALTLPGLLSGKSEMIVFDTESSDDETDEEYTLDQCEWISIFAKDEEIDRRTIKECKQTFNAAFERLRDDPFLKRKVDNYEVSLRRRGIPFRVFIVGDLARSKWEGVIKGIDGFEISGFHCRIAVDKIQQPLLEIVAQYVDCYLEIPTDGIPMTAEEYTLVNSSIRIFLLLAFGQVRANLLDWLGVDREGRSLFGRPVSPVNTGEKRITARRVAEVRDETLQKAKDQLNDLWDKREIAIQAKSLIKNDSSTSSNVQPSDDPHGHQNISPQAKEPDAIDKLKNIEALEPVFQQQRKEWNSLNSRTIGREKYSMREEHRLQQEAYDALAVNSRARMRAESYLAKLDLWTWRATDLWDEFLKLSGGGPLTNEVCRQSGSPYLKFASEVIHHYEKNLFECLKPCVNYYFVQQQPERMEEAERALIEHVSRRYVFEAVYNLRHHYISYFGSSLFQVGVPANDGIWSVDGKRHRLEDFIRLRDHTLSQIHSHLTSEWNDRNLAAPAYLESERHNIVTHDVSLIRDATQGQGESTAAVVGDENKDVEWVELCMEDEVNEAGIVQEAEQLVRSTLQEMQQDSLLGKKVDAFRDLIDDAEREAVEAYLSALMKLHVPITSWSGSGSTWILLKEVRGKLADIGVARIKCYLDLSPVDLPLTTNERTFLENSTRLGLVRFTTKSLRDILIHGVSEQFRKHGNKEVPSSVKKDIISGVALSRDDVLSRVKKRLNAEFSKREIVLEGRKPQGQGEVHTPIESLNRGTCMALNRFSRNGDGWDIIFRGLGPVHKKKSEGARRLAILLMHPGELIFVGRLAKQGEWTDDMESGSKSMIDINKGINELNHSLPDYGVEDLESMNEEIRRLREEASKAMEAGKERSADSIEKQIEQLQEHIRLHTAQSGIPRRKGGLLDRQIDAVRRSITRFVDSLKEDCKDLYQHLEGRVVYGKDCMYLPSSDVKWEIEL